VNSDIKEKTIKEGEGGRRGPLLSRGEGVSFSQARVVRGKISGGRGDRGPSSQQGRENSLRENEKKVIGKGSIERDDGGRGKNYVVPGKGQLNSLYGYSTRKTNTCEILDKNEKNGCSSIKNVSQRKKGGGSPEDWGGHPLRDIGRHRKGLMEGSTQKEKVERKTFGKNNEDM